LWQAAPPGEAKYERSCRNFLIIFALERHSDGVAITLNRVHDAGHLRAW
jgi:hypothetical protein